MSRTPLLVVAAVLALVLAGLSVGGGAYAADRVEKIGKNLVVTKSIKNGAVTTAKLAPGAVDGSRVKDGSLTAADLAPGTIPAAKPHKSVLSSSIAVTSTAPAASMTYAASGPYTVGEVIYNLAPVDFSVSDLRARLQSVEGAGQSRTVTLFGGPEGGASALLSCIVTPGTQTCSSSGNAVIHTGDIFYMAAQNDATNGSVGGVLESGFVVTIP